VPIIRFAGETAELFKSYALALDEFIPIVKFDRQSFRREKSVRIVHPDSYTLSPKIEKNKQQIDLYSFTLLPGEYTLPFKIEKGFGTWDGDGYIEPAIEPRTQNVTIAAGNKIKASYGGKFNITLNITGHASRRFFINFLANDDEDFFNTGEYKNVKCGRIQINVAGSSAVGFKLIENVDALPHAPQGYSPPNWDTTSASEIALSQQQANQYANCGGVCYATTESRAQQAYIDLTGSGVVNLTVSKNNVDHRIAATYGTNDSYMGYGAGGPFVLHGHGEIINHAQVWSGRLKRGALLQRWNSTDQNNLYANGGHSVIFRNYLYNNNGNITGLEFTDYHGGVNGLSGQPWSSADTTHTIQGVNLLD